MRPAQSPRTAGQLIAEARERRDREELARRRLTNSSNPK